MEEETVSVPGRQSDNTRENEAVSYQLDTIPFL